jgi:hypothetical protein
MTVSFLLRLDFLPGLGFLFDVPVRVLQSVVLTLTTQTGNGLVFRGRKLDGSGEKTLEVLKWRQDALSNIYISLSLSPKVEWGLAYFLSGELPDLDVPMIRVE